MTFPRCRFFLVTGMLVIPALGLTACGSSQASHSGRTGAGIGALAGLVTGGSMVDGAILGGGLGYIVGNEKDKEAAQQQAAAERARREQSRLTADPSTSFMGTRENPLTATTWQVVSLVSDVEMQEYSGLVVTFQTNSRVTTLAILPDGSNEAWVETYRIVDDVLVFSGTDPNSGDRYIINMRFTVTDDEMVVSGEDFRAVLREVSQ